LCSSQSYVITLTHSGVTVQLDADTQWNNVAAVSCRVGGGYNEG